MIGFITFWLETALCKTAQSAVVTACDAIDIMKQVTTYKQQY